MKVVVALIMFCLPWSVQGATVQPTTSTFEAIVIESASWRTVGGDACNKNKACTPEWAYNEAVKQQVLPREVADQAIAAFLKADKQVAEGKTPDWEPYQVCKDDVVSTSFGARLLRFVSNMTATFEGCTPALGWTFFDAKTGQGFEVFRVIKCGNYSSRPVKPVNISSLISGGDASVVTAAFPSSGLPQTTGSWPHVFTPPDTGGGGGGGGGHHCTHNCGGGHCVDVDCNPPPPSPVPIPATLILLFSALGSLVLIRR